MSVMVTVYLPEGIVMATDSRLTRWASRKDEYGVTQIENFTASDNTQKIFLLSKVKVGIASCGNAMPANKTVADYLRIFEIEKVETDDTVSIVAKKLFEYAEPYRESVRFFVCGYNEDLPYVYEVVEHIKRFNSTKIQGINEDIIQYGAAWNGQQEAITRLLNTEPATNFNFPLMPLKDGIDFAEFLVDTTIKYDRFKDAIQTCGGDIDILVLTKDDAFWYKHKIYKR